jgi:hypothetical protein
MNDKAITYHQARAEAEGAAAAACARSEARLAHEHLQALHRQRAEELSHVPTMPLEWDALVAVPAPRPRDPDGT